MLAHNARPHQDAKALTRPDQRSGFCKGSLVNGIAQGDKNMENQLIEHYHPLILAYLRRFIGDRSRAEDMTHESLITVLLRLRARGIDQPEQLDGFVYQTARYSYLGWRRQLGNQPAPADAQQHPTTSRDATEQGLIAEQRQQLVSQLVNRLHLDRDRELITRTYLWDESKQHVCDVLRLAPAHFDRINHRARMRLRSLLGNESTDVLAALSNASA